VKHLILFVSSIMLVVAAGHRASAQDLKKLSLDDSSSIGLKLTTDSVVKVEGAASLRIETRWPTSVCLGEVSRLDAEGAQLLFRARVRTDLEGDAFLEMWVQVAGGQYFSRGMNSRVGGKSDWKAIQTPFTLQKGQKPDNVTLNIIVNGKGTVWVDDVVLSKAANRTGAVGR
jgi:hypothetical protein